METEGTLGNIILIAVIFLFMLGSIFLRRRSMEKTEMGKVVTLLSEINQNLKIIDDFSFTLQVKKFQTASWLRNRDKLDFLDERLKKTLVRAFAMAEECNLQIDAAKKYKSSSYLASIEVDRLRESMTNSQHELGEWLSENKDRQELQPKRPGLFGR
jgi:hypothetical protein